MTKENFVFSAIVTSTLLWKLKLPLRIQNSLIRVGITDINKLITSIDQGGLESIKGLGANAIQTIYQSIKALDECLLSDGNIDWQAYYKIIGVELDSEPNKKVSRLPDTRISIPDEIIALSIGHLHLPLRIYNALLKANILAIGELLLNLERQFKNVSGIGPNALEIVSCRLQGLANANDQGEFSWFAFWKSQNITLIPESYCVGTANDTINKHLSHIIKAILQQDDEGRNWRIIQRRFGLDQTKRLTLDEIGKAFDLTRERVRQIETKALEELRNVLLDDQYVDRNYHIHPEITSAIKKLFTEVILHAPDLILESNLFAIVERVWGINIANAKPSLALLFNLAKMNQIEFTDPDLTPVWEVKPSSKSNLVIKVVSQIDALLTSETALAIDEFDLLLSVNKCLPKGQKISATELQHFIGLCSTIEKRKDDLYQGKFIYLKSRGNQVQRILVELGKPLHTSEIVREINNRTVPFGGRKLSERNLSNQMLSDSRFMPIGRSGIWALSSWDHIDTNNVIVLIERCLIERNSPATVDEIFEYINKRRPVNPSSITMYLTQRTDLFNRVDRTSWGLTSWAESDDVKTWNPEQVADFVATIFKQYKTKELEFRVIKEALCNAAKVSEKQAQGMLNINPVIQTRRESYKKLYAILQPDYRQRLETVGARFERKKATISEQFAENIRTILLEVPGQELAINTLVDQLMKLYGYKRPLVYAYINRMPFIEKYTIPGSRTIVCKIKGRKNFTFSQVEEINDKNIRAEIQRAIQNLTLDNVDIGLFLLGRQFEVVIKRALIKGSQKGIISLGAGLNVEPSRWKLVQMVDSAKQCGLISDLGVANLLRQERNERAHGEPPSLEEREALMNSIQYLAGLYIDYIILFCKRELEWG